MKRERLLLPGVFIALTIGFIACNKDNSNSTAGDSNLGIKIQALNKNFSLPVSDIGLKSATAGAASITWDTATMVVSTVAFESKLKSLVSHHDSIEISYKWNGPTVINLLDSVISVGNYVMQPGFYDEIEIKVDGLKKDAGAKPVFYLHGIYTKSDLTTLDIKVLVNENISFKTEKDSVEITPTDNADFTTAIQLYLDQLMLNVQPSVLDNATLTGGILVISHETNKSLYGILVGNLLKNHHWKHSHKHGNGHM